MEFYKWELRSDVLYLHAPVGDISDEEKDNLFILLKKEIALRNITINPQKLKLWFYEKLPQPLKVSNCNEFDGKGKIDIKVGENLLNAYLTIFPPIGTQQKISVAEIKKAILKKGVTYGIDEVKIMIALTENKFVVDLPVAKGKEPIAGKDAVIKYHFIEKGVEIKPKELDNGKVDFYNINLIQNVKKGQLLVEKIPATKGISGMTVTGKEIPGKDGKDTILPLGKNLYISEDHLKGFAACEGHVAIVKRRVSVLPVFEVNGDVDFSTGNINFVGNVVVKGNIKDGFTVKADGDIEIYGTVEGGHVLSSGNILVRKGIRGLKKSRVEAKGSIYSNFIEHANITAGEDVIVTEAIMHSTVNSGLTIQVGGRKGLVVGGICRAGKALICKNIGSNLATLTNIEVGIKPELRLEYKEVCQNQVINKQNLEKTLKALRLLKEIKEKTNNLPPDKQVLQMKLMNIKEQLFKQQEDLFLHRKELEEQIKELGEGYVKISGVMNCGVSVAIGKASKHFTNERHKVILKQKGMDISIIPLTDIRGGKANVLQSD